MHFGIKALKKKIPLVIKRIAVVAGAISLAIGGYGMVAEDTFFKQLGGWCLIVSAGVPPLFGVQEEKKDEE